MFKLCTHFKNEMKQLQLLQTKKKTKFIMMPFLPVRTLCFINYFVANSFFFKLLLSANRSFSEPAVNPGHLGSTCTKWSQYVKYCCYNTFLAFHNGQVCSKCNDFLILSICICTTLKSYPFIIRVLTSYQ